MRLNVSFSENKQEFAVKVGETTVVHDSITATHDENGNVWVRCVSASNANGNVTLA